MEQAETFFPRYAGTPSGFRRVGFRFPNGAPIVALVEAPEDWNVSVFVEPDTYRSWIISVSPNNEGIRIIRGLRNHPPKEVRYATVAEQSAALGGKTATANTHKELVEAAKPGIAAEDAPPPVPQETLSLVEALPNEELPDTPNGRPRRPRIRDYRFATSDSKTYIRCNTKPPTSLRSKSEESKLVKAFKNGEDEMFFLFDEGTDYLLECIRCRFYRTVRKEARSAKAVHTGLQPNEVIEAMIPNLAVGTWP